jgi:hypothetical protein
MPSLADLPELLGVLSYTVDDAAHFLGALSRLRAVIQRELAAQLGRPEQVVRLYSLRSKILIERSVFFIPIITPTALDSDSWRMAYSSILARETALSRADLVFPILLIDVPNLDRSIVGTRQYVDWRPLPITEVASAEVTREVKLLCKRVLVALTASIDSQALQKREKEKLSSIGLPKRQIVSHARALKRREDTLAGFSNSHGMTPPRFSSAETPQLGKPAPPQPPPSHALVQSPQLNQSVPPEPAQLHSSEEGLQLDRPAPPQSPLSHSSAESPQLGGSVQPQPLNARAAALSDEAAMANFLQRFEAALVAEDSIPVEEKKEGPEAADMRPGDLGASLEPSLRNTAQNPVMTAHEKQDAASDDKRGAMEAETTVNLWRRLATWIADGD